jgi:hypothetical protein
MCALQGGAVASMELSELCASKEAAAAVLESITATGGWQPALVQGCLHHSLLPQHQFVTCLLAWLGHEPKHPSNDGPGRSTAQRRVGCLLVFIRGSLGIATSRCSTEACKQRPGGTEYH